MSKISLRKYKRPSKNSKLHKKSKKRIPTRNNFVIVFASKFRCINPHATWGISGGDICTSSVTCWATCEEVPGIAGSTFDGGWGTRWWQDVDGRAENEEWAVGVGEDGKVGVYGDVTVDRSGSGMLDGGWNFIWDHCGDAVNVFDFGGAVGELSKNFWCFGLKGVAVADSDWNEDDWESAWIETRFGLGTEDGDGDLINDGCDKYDDEDCDDCGNNTSCNVSIINFENLMFPFSVSWRWSL